MTSMERKKRMLSKRLPETLRAHGWLTVLIPNNRQNTIRDAIRRNK